MFPTDPQPMVPIAVEEPTVRMTFGVNKSPLAGREGKFLTTRMIRDRLMKELDRNVALRVEETDSSDAYEVRSCETDLARSRIGNQRADPTVWNNSRNPLGVAYLVLIFDVFMCSWIPLGFDNFVETRLVADF